MVNNLQPKRVTRLPSVNPLVAGAAPSAAPPPTPVLPVQDWVNGNGSGIQTLDTNGQQYPVGQNALYSQSDWGGRSASAVRESLRRENLPKGQFIATSNAWFAESLTKEEQNEIFEHNRGVYALANAQGKSASSLPTLEPIVALAGDYGDQPRQIDVTNPRFAAADRGRSSVVGWKETPRGQLASTGWITREDGTQVLNEGEVIPGSQDATRGYGKPPASPSPTSPPPAGAPTDSPTATGTPTTTPAGSGSTTAPGLGSLSSSFVDDYKNMAGPPPAPSDFGLGDTYKDLTAAEAATISSDTGAMTRYLLKGQGADTPSNVSRYSESMKSMPFLYVLENMGKLGIDAASLEQGDDQSAMDALFSQVMDNEDVFRYGKQFLESQQGGGVDPNKAMSLLFETGLGTSTDPGKQNPIDLLANSGSPQQQIEFVTGAITDSMVNANPYISGIVGMMVNVLGEQYLASGGSDAGFLDWLAKNSFFGAYAR